MIGRAKARGNTRRNAEPHTHLRALEVACPELWALVDQFRAARGISLPIWPDWCFLPLAGWHAIANAVLEDQQLSPPLLTLAAARLAAIGSWRYCQGTYRFEADLTAALLQSPPCLPTLEMALALPEHCIYIETPQHRWQGDALYGFWAHLEWDAQTDGRELRLLLHTRAEFIPLAVPIGPWYLTEAIERVADIARTRAEQFGLTAPLSRVAAPHQLAELEVSLQPLLARVTYFSTDAWQRWCAAHNTQGDTFPPQQDSSINTRRPRLWVLKRQCH